jgi:hypothetical protein
MEGVETMILGGNMETWGQSLTMDTQVMVMPSSVALSGDSRTLEVTAAGRREMSETLGLK